MVTTPSTGDVTMPLLGTTAIPFPSTSSAKVASDTWSIGFTMPFTGDAMERIRSFSGFSSICFPPDIASSSKIFPLKIKHMAMVDTIAAGRPIAIPAKPSPKVAGIVTKEDITIAYSAPPK